MITYLIDSSAVWRVERDDALNARWASVIAEGAIGSCAAQRTEFRRSARNVDELDEIDEMYADLFPDVPHPKTTRRWIEGAQHRLVRRRVGRAFSVVDLSICATAAHHGLTILHDDADFDVAAQHLTDVSARRVTIAPTEF